MKVKLNIFPLVWFEGNSHLHTTTSFSKNVLINKKTLEVTCLSYTGTKTLFRGSKNLEQAKLKVLEFHEMHVKETVRQFVKPKDINIDLDF